MNQDAKNYYESNMAFLKKYQPHVWKRITNQPIQPIGTVFYTSQGLPNLTVDTEKNQLITLHNEADPESESDQLLKKIPEDHKGVISILGMGLGYQILKILKNRPLLQYLAVFELEPGIFIQALTHVDLAELLEDRRLILNLGEPVDISQAMTKASRTLQLEDAAIYNHLPSCRVNTEGYAKLKTDLYAHINSLNVGGATTRKLGKDFMRNRLEHISTIHHHYLLECMNNRFSNMPAILVAGGPSLNKNVHLLNQVQEHAVIFAVDTVLPTLLENGIRPHFLTSIDPNNLTFEKFANVIPRAKEISLICSSWVNIRTAKIFPASHIFWTFTAKPVEAWINRLLGGQLMTRGSSTVAHLNLTSAHMLGCDPIIFIGQDLSYSENATHAKGTVLQGTIEKKMIVVGSGLGETVKGIDGTILQTNRAFLSMKNHFESFIAKTDRVHINSTEGGAHIEGTKVMPFQAAIETYCRNDISASRRIREYADTAGKIDNQKLLSVFGDMEKKIKGLYRKIKQSDTLTDSVLKELKKVSRKKKTITSINDFPYGTQKQIIKIDACHKTLDNELFIWQILEEITMEGLKEADRRKQEINLYQADNNKYCQWLVKNLHHLSEINKVRTESLEILEQGIHHTLRLNAKEKQTGGSIEKIRLYMETGNYSLASPIVDILLAEQPKSSELNFFAGCIAKLTNRRKKARQYFENALLDNPEFVDRISAFNRKMGDDYYTFTKYFQSAPGREDSVRYMIFKGLEYCPDHEGLRKEINTLISDDLKKIEQHIKSKTYRQVEEIFFRWEPTGDQDQQIVKSIDEKLYTRLLYFKGKYFLKDKLYSQAYDILQKALLLSPLNKDLHFLIIDTCFLAENYHQAVEAIEKAIHVDKKFATYWEIIGDKLRDAGQHADAIIAFERCFTSLPENLEILKKIGDTYLAAGQLEAAKASYEHFKMLLKKNSG